MAVSVNEDVLKMARSKTQYYLSHGSFGSAVFLADKVASMSQGEVEDILVLAQALLAANQVNRARSVLQRHGEGVQADPRAKYIIGQCLNKDTTKGGLGIVIGSGFLHKGAKEEQWEECLSLLEEAFPSHGSVIDKELAACLHLLRGKACMNLNNRRRAVSEFREALEQDPCCWEAFERLFGGRLLTTAEADEVLLTVEFPPELEWLRLIYVDNLREHVDEKGEDPVGVALSKRFGLGSNLDVLSRKAERLFNESDLRGALELTTKILEKDPHHRACLPVHLATLVGLERVNDLLFWGHRLVDDDPESAVSWFGVGCYYYAAKQYENARRYFSKATLLDVSFAPAWMGFGHAFAKDGEHDQALAAYRTGSRLFIGSYMGPLCIAMECLQSNNLSQAHACLKQAQKFAPNNPLVYNELGVWAYRKKQWKQASVYFSTGLKVVQRRAWTERATLLCNLGHTFRKMKEFVRAIELYQEALSLQPGEAEIMGPIALTYQLCGELDKAIDWYHKALSYAHDDAFCSEMLARAMQARLHQPLDF